MDFERESLDAVLERAGHNRSSPTCWIWEGVVMYLTRDTMRATLADLGSVGLVVHEDSGMADWNARFAQGRAKVE